MTSHAGRRRRSPDVSHLPPFETVVADHGAVVLRVCRAVLGPVDAEDAWSETFLAALRAFPSLRPDSDVRAWLVTIAHRKAIDGYRARKRAPLPVESLPHEPSAVDAHEPIDDRLLAAVDALPDKQRHVVAYRYLADLSYAAIAEIVGGSAEAARRSAADGIATLRRSYAQNSYAQNSHAQKESR
ncbi:MAG TPA: sigma-70 family RNA polymerase sigma factor [Jatrophihabitans sp.]|nr:sigma-70 family RNA polymerase sigma factor [Jatrophihabitans sp.]